MLISQELFDETLLESQELFDYSDNDQAVQETISELESQNKDSKLDHLSLTHPDSEQGKKDREMQKSFVDALNSEDLSLAMAILINANAASATTTNGGPYFRVEFNDGSTLTHNIDLTRKFDLQFGRCALCSIAGSDCF